jgi:two-component system, response regulator YesN
MRKLLEKYRATIFTRIILSYTIFAVVLIGLAGGYLYSQANRMMVDEIAQDSKTRLESTRDYIEQTLLTKYQNDLQNRVAYTSTHHNDNNLNFLLDSDWDGNLSKIVSFRQDLEFLKAINEGVSNLTVYFRTGNYVVDSQGFFMQPENSTDGEFILSLDRIPSKKWFARTLPDGKQVMSYVVMLPYQTSGAAGKGYFFVDVDMAFIQKSAATILGSPSDRLYMMDGSGSVFVQTTTGEEDELELLDKAISQGKSVMEITDKQLGKVVLSHLPGSQSSYGWSYAIIRPMNSFVLSSKEFQTSIFIGCGVVLLIGLLISYMISKQFYNPIKGLMTNLRQLYQPQNDQSRMNEYALINSAMNFMGQKIRSLETQADTERLKNIVLGTGQGTEFPEALCRSRGYQVSYIRVLEGCSEKIEMWFEQNDHPPQCEYIVLNAGEAALLYKANNRSVGRDETIMLVLLELKEAMKGQVRFGAAIGSWVELPEEIQFSYQMALQAYRYRFIYGADAIILHSKIASLDSTPHMFSFDIYKYVLKAGDNQGADRFLDDFAEVMMHKNLRLEAVEIALLQLVTSIYQVVIELELQQLVSPSNLLDELKKDTLTATVDSIRTLSAQIAVHVRESSNHAHADVIMKLRTYIDDHLQDDLSLNVMSDVASLAPAYVSTLFGEVMKESFTEYVTRVRLEKAASLLQEEGRMSIAEIASRVGYRNPQYFHNKFKSRFGITPVKYRNVKAMISEAN